MEITNPRTGIRCSYNITGRGGHTVVFVHGWTANHVRWGRVVKLLSPSFICVDYDLRGHGLSEKGADLKYDFESYVEDLAGLMDALGLENVIVAGHSMGGMIAQHFALAYPERVEKLVLVATAACVAKDEKSRRKMRALAWLFRNAFPLMIWLKDGKKKKEPDKFPDVLDPALKCSARASGDSLMAIANMDLRGRIKAIKVPTLVLAAEADKTVPIADTREMAGLIPGAKLLTFTDCGHHLNIEQHEKIAAAIKDFIS